MLGKGAGVEETGDFLLFAFFCKCNLIPLPSHPCAYKMYGCVVKNMYYIYRPSMRDSSSSIDYVVPTTTSTNKVGSKLGKIRRATGGSDAASTTIAGNHGDKFMGGGGGYGGEGGDSSSRRKSGGGNNQEEEKDDGYDVRAAFEKEHKGKFLGGRVCELYMCWGGYCFFRGIIADV